MKNNANRIFCEAESFEDYGGWSLDTQFETEMGSPYLLAHGLGRPVADATTHLSCPTAGRYYVWARVRDWVPKYHPGRFDLLVNGQKLMTLGESGENDWIWEKAGTVELREGENEICLHDLTGFEGRCDAIYFSTDPEDAPPEEGKQVDRSWRKKLLGISEVPIDGETYDVVVVGGGMAGCSAALVAAKTGSRVLLLTDRPVLCGNASVEIGLGPRGYKGELVMQMCEREENGDMAVIAMLKAEPNVTVLLNEKVFAVEKDGEKIAAVDARNLLTGCETRYAAKVFIDASGKGAVARPAGAEIRTGREGKSAYNESLAPDAPDEVHHGHTVLYHLHEAPNPVEFPEVPWALEVARDFGNLNGQLAALGKDNQYGPDVTGQRLSRKKMKQMANLPGLGVSSLKYHRFPMVDIIDFFPGTHYWEYGQTLDLFCDGEEIRDHLLCALYGTMYNVKKAQPKKYANLEFEWIHHTFASGEFCRIIGDYVVNENEIREHAIFSDAVVQQDGAICIHCMENPTYDFRLTSWIWDIRDMKPYWIPFRSLYSKDVPNLMMVGKQISVTRVVGCNTKLMANGAEHGVAVGCAASLCVDKGVTPREIYEKHIPELKQMISRFEWEDRKSHQSIMQFFS